MLVTEYCQCRSLPGKLGCFEIACHGSKNRCAGGLKLGYFSSVCQEQLSFLSIQSVFEPLQCPKTFFSSISGIKMFWRSINIEDPLHTEVNNLIVFPPNWVFSLFYGWKAPKFGKLGLWSFDKNWATLKSFATGKKKQFAAVWCSEVLATLLVAWGLSFEVSSKLTLSFAKDEKIMIYAYMQMSKQSMCMQLILVLPDVDKHVKYVWLHHGNGHRGTIHGNL